MAPLDSHHQWRFLRKPQHYYDAPRGASSAPTNLKTKMPLSGAHVATRQELYSPHQGRMGAAHPVNAGVLYI